MVLAATPAICKDFLQKGTDILVTGNHVWQQRELIPFLDECKRIVRPLNYPPHLPGHGFVEFELANGKKNSGHPTARTAFYGSRRLSGTGN